MGNMAKTTSGHPCQAWTVTSPQSHTYDDQTYFPDNSVPGAVCRSTHTDYIWCYTTSSSTRWEVCDIIKCGE